MNDWVIKYKNFRGSHHPGSQQVRSVDDPVITNNEIRIERKLLLQPYKQMKRLVVLMRRKYKLLKNWLVLKMDKRCYQPLTEVSK